VLESGRSRIRGEHQVVDALLFGGMINKSMKFEKLPATIAFTGVLLTGCTSSDQLPPPSPTPVATESSSPFLYDATPDSNVSFTECSTNTNSWAVNIDSNPKGKDLDASQDHTVGIYDKHADAGTTVELLAGLRLRRLGDYVYQVATSADIAGASAVINLNEEAYSRVLRVGRGYDVVVAVRLAPDGNVYSTINCLPQFGYYGDSARIPLLPPTSPPWPSEVPAGRDESIAA
jgi:hypothetical protein